MSGRTKHLFTGRRRLLAAGFSGLLVVAVAALVAAPPGSAGIGRAPLQVTEHFNGKTFTLTPRNWHGAKDCAIVTPTDAYCFSSNAAFNSFTSVSRAPDGSAIASSATPTSPATTGVCNGWAKIWNGINWTGTGLAFEDYGYQQNLADYYSPMPFPVESWFTDGQRGYAKMTNCFGIADNPGTITLHTNAEATNDGVHNAHYIELYYGVG